MEEKIDMDNERHSYYYYIHFSHYRRFCIDVQQLSFLPAKNTGDLPRIITRPNAAARRDAGRNPIR
jgi:hypothetical protein